jgi:hypothetical protein
VTQGLEIPCSIQLSYERKCTGLKDGKVNLGWRKVNWGSPWEASALEAASESERVKAEMDSDYLFDDTGDLQTQGPFL